MAISAVEFFSKGCGTVTLCGSTKFFFECMEANRVLTFKGWVVLMCGSWGHSYHKFDASMHDRDYSVVKKLHLHKISMSDAILVVTENDYHGESTQMEIAYAKELGLPVFYFQNGEFSGNSGIEPPQRKPFDISKVDRFMQAWESAKCINQTPVTLPIAWGDDVLEVSNDIEQTLNKDLPLDSLQDTLVRGLVMILDNQWKDFAKKCDFPIDPKLSRATQVKNLIKRDSLTSVAALFLEHYGDTYHGQILAKNIDRTSSDKAFDFEVNQRMNEKDSLDVFGDYWSR